MKLKRKPAMYYKNRCVSGRTLFNEDCRPLYFWHTHLSIVLYEYQHIFAQLWELFFQYGSISCHNRHILVFHHLHSQKSLKHKTFINLAFNMNGRILFLATLVLLICVAQPDESSKNVSIDLPHVQPSQSKNTTCPNTWFILNNETEQCQCGESIGDVVKCNETTKEVKVVDCYCVTYDSTDHEAVVGLCVYNCVNVTKSYKISMCMPADFTESNNSVCGYLYRTGTLCGNCIHRYVPPVYSYSMECMTCGDRDQMWWQYIAFVYAPLAVNNCPAVTQCCYCVCRPKPSCLKSLPNNACSRKPEFITVHRYWCTLYSRCILPWKRPVQSGQNVGTVSIRVFPKWLKKEPSLIAWTVS